MGILPLAFSLDHAGPLAWTTEDCAILLQAMVGHDPYDPASANYSPPDYRAALQGSVKGLRVGLIRHFYERDSSLDSLLEEAGFEPLAPAATVLSPRTIISSSRHRDVIFF